MILCLFFSCSASCKTMQREYNETCDGDFLTLGITSSLPCSKQLPLERAQPVHLCKESNDVSYIVSGRDNCFLLLCLFAIFGFGSQSITIYLYWRLETQVLLNCLYMSDEMIAIFTEGCMKFFAYNTCLMTTDIVEIT